MSNLKYILGSRSPRRLELLRQIVPAERIEVVPPLSTDEAGLDGLHDWPAIESRMLEIARSKCDDVLAQLQDRARTNPRDFPNPGDFGDDVVAVITADTTIVANDDDGRLMVLGQPPEDDTWPETVRHWFRDFYAGRTHAAVTALCVTVLPRTPLSGERGASAPCLSEQPSDAGRSPANPRDFASRVIKSEVTFHANVERWLDWYIATGEPKGKAGGYAIQDAGGIFVSRVEGSLSNVVGLPLRELLHLFEELGVDAI